MKRFLAALVLIIFVIGSTSFAGGRYLANGPDDNFFNTHYRKTLASSPFWRGFFGLWATGDAASDYLDSDYDKILIETDSLAGMSPSPQVLYDLAERIEQATGKPVTVVFSNEDIPLRDLKSTEEIDDIIQAYRNDHSGGDSAVVYVLIVSKLPDEPDSLGTTRGHDQLILFNQAIEDFTADQGSTYDNYFLSTALHEFGHLLGLPYNDQANCLMNTHAEADHIPKFNARDVLTNFCPYEREQLLQLK